MNSIPVMNRAADNIRILAAAMVEKAKSGHPGGAMGGADFINVLYSEFLQFDPKNPTWKGRDRFFLDPGHMSPMLYAELTLIGKFTLEELSFMPRRATQPSGRKPYMPTSATAAYRKKSVPAQPASQATWGWTTSSCSTMPTTSNSPPRHPL